MDARKNQPQSVPDYQRIVHHAPVVLFTLDPHGVCTMAQGKSLALLDLTPTDLIGYSTLDLFADTPHIVADIQTALQGQASHKIQEFRGRYFETFYEPIFDAQGQVEEIVGLSLDVTERVKIRLDLEHKAEQALLESEERFRGLMASISDHIYVTEVTPEGGYRNIYISDHVEPLTGYSSEELLKNWRLWSTQIIYPPDAGVAAAQLARLTAGQSSEVEYRLVRRDGQVIWVRDSARVHAESPAAKVIYGLVSDITLRKRTEEEIRQLNEELEQRVLDRTRELSALYEVTAVASQVLDQETTLKLSLARVLAAMRSQVGFIHLLDEEGQTLRLVTEQGLLPEVAVGLKIKPFGKDLISQIVEGGEMVVIPNITSTSSWPQMAAMPGLIAYAGVPIRVSGQHLGVLSVFGTQEQQFSVEEVALLASIADQVGVLVENARLRQQAERTAIIEERNRLARDLHDAVTQSLYSLTLFAEVGREQTLAQDLASLERTLTQIGTISQQALKEMRLLVHELRPLDLQQEGLVGALHRRLSAVERRANTKARLIVEDWMELPALMEEELYRIAQEALNNALKHTGATAVNVYLRMLEGHVEMEVVDNGDGFQFEKIQSRGGLGLTSMRERAEKLGGALLINSAPGMGTRVKVRVKTQEKDIPS